MTVERIAVVTGGAGGIGAATAKALASHGWAICVADLAGAAGAQTLVDEVVGLGGAAMLHEMDVSDSRCWARLVGALTEFGVPCRGLVNNAGTAGGGGVLRTTDEQFHRVHAVNVYGPFYGMRALAPLMRDAGGGSVANVASVAGLVGFPDAGYTSSKAALRGLSKTAAAELAPFGIRVNTVHPGLVGTAMAGDDTAFLDAHEASIPLGQAARPEQIADAIAWLLSDESSYVTATELVVDGGFAGAGSYFQIAQRTRSVRAAVTQRSQADND